MPQSKRKSEYTAAELLPKAKPSESPDIYANHIQVSVSGNEIFLDFYYISPNISDPQKPTIQHIQRTVSPIPLAKGLATAIANVVAMFEKDHDVVLPSARETNEMDLITIWPPQST